MLCNFLAKPRRLGALVRERPRTVGVRLEGTAHSPTPMLLAPCRTAGADRGAAAPRSHSSRRGPAASPAALLVVCAVFAPLGAARAQDVLPEGRLIPLLPSSVVESTAHSAASGELFMGYRPTAGGPTAVPVVLHREAPPGTWQVTGTIAVPLDVDATSFGNAIAADGARLFIGADDADLPGTTATGRVFEYVLDGQGVWQRGAVLVEPTPTSRFGNRITLVGDVAVVDEHVFHRDASGAWTAVYAIPAANLSTSIRAVVEGGSIFTSTGSSSVFELRPNGSGGYAVHTTVTNPVGASGSDGFGQTFDVRGDVLAIGSNSTSPASGVKGLVHLYLRENDGGWELVQTLSGPSSHSLFGRRLGLLDDRLFVSSQRTSAFGQAQTIVFAYQPFDAWTWTPVATYVDVTDGGPSSMGARVEPEESLCILGSTLAGTGPHVVRSSSILRSNDEVSLSQFGEQFVHFRPPPSFANGWYVLLGSMSGTAPGLSFGGLTVPLVQDAYTVATALGFGPFRDGQGPIDAAARAFVRLHVPNGTTPSIAGLTLHHAFIGFDPVNLVLTASEPAALHLVP